MLSIRLAAFGRGWEISVDGLVQANQASLSIPIVISGQPDASLEFVIDTGFVGYLTLSLAAIQALGLPFLRPLAANLADDSTIYVDVYGVTIRWHGIETETEVLATGRRPLLGTLLLNGSEMNVQFAEGGLVNLDTL